jgi:hypothetical protein
MLSFSKVEKKRSRFMHKAFEQMDFFYYGEEDEERANENVMRPKTNYQNS